MFVDDSFYLYLTAFRFSNPLKWPPFYVLNYFVDSIWCFPILSLPETQLFQASSVQHKILDIH